MPRKSGDQPVPRDLHSRKLFRLKRSVEELRGRVPREIVRELVYAAAAVARQGSGLTTREIEDILVSVPTILDFREELK